MPRSLIGITLDTLIDYFMDHPTESVEQALAVGKKIVERRRAQEAAALAAVTANPVPVPTPIPAAPPVLPEPAASTRPVTARRKGRGADAQPRRRRGLPAAAPAAGPAPVNPTGPVAVPSTATAPPADAQPRRRRIPPVTGPVNAVPVAAIATTTPAAPIVAELPDQAIPYDARDIEP